MNLNIQVGAELVEPIAALDEEIKKANKIITEIKCNINWQAVVVAQYFQFILIGNKYRKKQLYFKKLLHQKTKDEDEALHNVSRLIKVISKTLIFCVCAN